MKRFFNSVVFALCRYLLGERYGFYCLIHKDVELRRTTNFPLDEFVCPECEQERKGGA